MIDAHAHLTDERIVADLEDVLARAAQAGIERILTCGEDVASSEAAVALAHRWPIVRAAVGIHPHRAAACDERSLGRIAELAEDDRVVAIGEIGIDLSGRSAPAPRQERAFLAQLRLAARLGLPVCVHSRDAGAAVRDAIDGVGSVKGYAHCYSEGPDELDAWMRRGFAVSFAGTVTYPKNDALRAAAAIVPADHLLLETDAPYLAPQRHRGRRNEPAFVAATYAALADVRGVAVDALAAQVRRNTAVLFGARW